MKRVVVVDFGLGNLHSVVKALRHEGADVVVTESPADVHDAERLVLPGVGAFADGMAGLQKRSLVEPVLEFIATGRPFLGICVGMQVLLGESEEFGRHEGLGVIPGKVQLIPKAAGRKVPHIGWNRAHPVRTWSGSLLEPLEAGTMLYFVHSYTAVPDDDAHRLADTDYAGYRVSAAVQKDNVVGVQFHPEKSGTAGLVVLARYLR
ncbi:MAG TPA: imidazole glycerol phosphate synthase subunit HisH [Kofleriaceae bacterium]|nr:imidazole glycerol phosphate synthase subunit HisH [Kofleriaceae bacterium]